MKTTTRVWSAFLAIVLAPYAAAYWIGLQEVPIARILPQLEKRVLENPKDAHGQYLLGRVHGAAFGQRAASIRMNDEKNLDGPRNRFRGESVIGATVLQKTVEGPRLSDEALRAHLTDAISHLSSAVELSPEDALYRLGFACALDTGSSMAPQIDSNVMSAMTFDPLTERESKDAATDLVALKSTDAAERAMAEARLTAMSARALPILSAYWTSHATNRQAVVGELLSNAWRELAIANYDRAFALTFDRDLKKDSLDADDSMEMISCESATSYLRLVKARGVRGEVEAKHVAHVEAVLETLRAIPGNATPILIPDRSDADLGGLFDGTTANFDLHGAGIVQTWQWPTSNASFLVWDPECSGEIRSGRQLFGSATWWMFFEDGYRALEALDADGNGSLTGDELEGLALWRDADRDGVSDAGEVESLRARGVVALATRADGIDGLSPTCSRGVMFANNSLRPTFDWVATPVRVSP